MNRTARTIIGFLFLAGILWGLTGEEARPALAGQVRHYYIQAENLEWTIVPSGYEDEKLGRWVEGRETLFTAIVLRSYEDPEFQRPSPRPPWFGILGPTVEAQVGDRIIVHFRNADFAYKRPHSLHTHGLHYTAQNDGAYMASGHPMPGTAIPPGGTYTYEWEAGPDSVGTWPYHDHSVDTVDNIRRGMIGAVVVRGPGEQPAKEFILLFSAFDRAVTRLRRDFFTINGRAFPGNLPGLDTQVGERVRFRVIGMGDEFHTFHLHGHRWNLAGQILDNFLVAPASAATFDFVEDAPGTWMLHCHVLDHAENGMMQHYTVRNP